MPKFSNEPGLIYRDVFVYPKNSIYRGQMKKRDESNKMKITSGDNQSIVSKPSGVMNGNFNDDEANLLEFRHGYGI